MTDTPTPLTDALIKERSRYVVFDDPEPMSMEDHARTLERDLTAMRERVVKYRARLEIDHHFTDFGGTLERVDLPFDEDEPYDGIACRDETIRLLDQARDEMRTDLTACRAVLRELVAVEDLGWRIHKMQDAVILKRQPPHRDFPAMWREWVSRKPLAWSAARAILQSTGEGEGK